MYDVPVGLCQFRPDGCAVGVKPVVLGTVIICECLTWNTSKLLSRRRQCICISYITSRSDVAGL